jgi:hypothetical protein
LGNASFKDCIFEDNKIVEDGKGWGDSGVVYASSLLNDVMVWLQHCSFTSNKADRYLVADQRGSQRNVTFFSDAFLHTWVIDGPNGEGAVLTGALLPTSPLSDTACANNSMRLSSDHPWLQDTQQVPLSARWQANVPVHPSQAICFTVD